MSHFTTTTGCLAAASTRCTTEPSSRSATAVAAYALPLKLNIVVAIGVAVLACFWLEKQFGLDVDAEDDQ